MRKKKPTEKIIEENQIRKKSYYLSNCAERNLSTEKKNRTLGVLTFIILPEHTIYRMYRNKYFRNNILILSL